MHAYEEMISNGQGPITFESTNLTLAKHQEIIQCFLLVNNMDRIPHRRIIIKDNNLKKHDLIWIYHKEVP